MTGHPRTATSAGAISQRLREAIRSGRLAPGTVLRQAELADEFGTSRIPVREALQALEGEGLVVIEANRGAFVSTLTAGELVEIFDLRVLLETEALRHAVGRHTERTLRRLESVQQELDRETDRHEWIALDRAFHEALYAPAERPRTAALIAGLRNAVERFYLAHLDPNARRRGWNTEHHDLLQHVKARRGKAAAEILARHLRETQALALKTLAAAA